MPEVPLNDYYYIDPGFIVKQGFGGKDFLREKINSYISTIDCMKEFISSCVDNYEIDNLSHCLTKLRSSMAELNIPMFTRIINRLILVVETSGPMEELSEIHKEFLLICELVMCDLIALKQNEGIIE